MRNIRERHVSALETLVSRMREQAGWCRRLGSPLYAHLMERIAVDLLAGGPSRDVLAGHEDDPLTSALALRLLGAVHRMALDGRAPAVAAHFPSAGGADRGDVWPAVRDLFAGHRDVLCTLLERPVQTNEVGRCAALLGGFVTVAAETGLPLALVEIGASAGLNLRWDRFHYEAAGATWGDSTSPVRMACDFTGPYPRRDVAVRVVARDGCDTNPLDPASDDGALTLQSYVWPDQLERLTLLRAAIEVARTVPARVDATDAGAWIGRHLAARPSGVATVVYHSIVWQYLTRDTRAAVKDAILRAGTAATREAPLAWLRLEPVGREGPFEVRLTSWPGGAERRLAESSPHGREVRWYAS